MNTLETSAESYEFLREQGVRSLNQGDPQISLRLFGEAFDRAQEAGNERLRDRAFCNLTAIQIELFSCKDESLTRLREILVRNGDQENCRLAAYYLARAHELKKGYKKALFYARIALERSTTLGRRDWIASAHNAVGNILIAESHFEQACVQYEQALEMISTGRSLERALILDNLGYCRIVEGRFSEGFRCLYESLRSLRGLGARIFERGPRLSLCFGLLEVGRYRSAGKHGLAALELAEEVGDKDVVKNALYLLGEAANLARDTGSAREHFTDLQERFFPADRYLPDFLLAIDVRKLINLKA